MQYGNKRDYRKIDIFLDGIYEASTTWSRTLRDAKKAFITKYKIDSNKVKCRFQK